MKKSLRYISLLLAAVFLLSGLLVCHAAPKADAGNPVVDADTGDTADADAGDTADADAGDAADANAGNAADADAGDTADADTGDADDDTADAGDTADENAAANAGDDGDDSSDTDSKADKQQKDNSKQTGADTADEEPAADDSEQAAEEVKPDADAAAAVEHDANSYEVYYEEDPIYYGEASNYSYNNFNDDGAVDSVSSNTTLFDSAGMSEEEAAPNDWSDITLNEKTVKTAGISDFSAIKSNTDLQDNGQWILYLGYVLIFLAVLGILYFVAATLTQRKAAQKAARMERRRTSSPARSAAARMDEKERRAFGNAQRTSHFADEAPSRSRRFSSKADTGEIYIPRRAAKKTK